MQTSSSFNEMQTVKRRFFALRNGIIADTLRKAGSGFKIIFGLNLPQLAEVAATTPHTVALAEALWQNNTTRESMLLAPMIYPADEFTPEVARRWMQQVPEPEVADVLCLKMLRRLPYALSLVDFACTPDAPDILCYTGLRIAANFADTNATQVLNVAQSVLAGNPERRRARMLALQLKANIEMDLS